MNQMNSNNKTFNQTSTLVFIDAGVDNYQQLFDGVVATAQPFVLDTATDGIQQIDEILQQYPGQKTVHIISHGAPGCLYLGNTQLSLDTLKQYAPQLQQWNIDNLLLYGCHVAAGDAGEEFISKLRGLTGAEIAASVTMTGNAVQGGNWELEVNTGQVNQPRALQTEVMASYSGVFNVQLEFAQNIGSSSTDQGLGIATDSNGNVWATGFFEGTIDIDGDGNNDLTSNGNADSYLAKFDSNGNFEFARNIGGSSIDLGQGIATDSNGNVWATGYFEGSINIDGQGQDDLTSNGSQDSYLAKFDSNGNFEFARNIGGSSVDRGHGIAMDSNGNVWATGYFSGTIDIDGDGNNDLTSNGGEDSYIAKFDSNGNFEVAKNIGGSNTDQGLGIATDSQGYVWTTGFFEGSIDFDGDGTDDLTSNGGQDSYVAKFDSNGDFEFAKKIGGSVTDVGLGIATDSDGNAWATGYFSGTIDIDGDGTDDLTSNGGQDSYVAKFDIDGNLEFAKNIGGSNTDQGLGIATDSDGNVWATGSFEGTIDIDGNGTDDLTSNGGEDSYVAKFSSDGNLLFAQNIGDSSSDQGRGIATDSNGNVWATGFFEGTINIDEEGTDNLTSNGGEDSYVVKFIDEALEGTPGNDIFRGTNITDNYSALDGNDRVYGNGGNDSLDGGDGNDIIYGGNDNDTLDGGLRHDRLNGDNGNDLLLGNDGNDILNGGAGDDTLNGGLGNDRYNGGAGADTFIIGPGLGLDMIQRFEDGTDIIELQGIGFDDLALVSSGSSTLIGVAATGEALATLSGINVSLVGMDDFSESVV